MKKREHKVREGKLDEKLRAWKLLSTNNIIGHHFYHHSRHASLQSYIFFYYLRIWCECDMIVWVVIDILGVWKHSSFFNIDLKWVWIIVIVSHVFILNGSICSRTCILMIWSNWTIKTLLYDEIIGLKAWGCFGVKSMDWRFDLGCFRWWFIQYPSPENLGSTSCYLHIDVVPDGFHVCVTFWVIFLDCVDHITQPLDHAYRTI